MFSVLVGGFGLITHFVQDVVKVGYVFCREEMRRLLRGLRVATRLSLHVIKLTYQMTFKKFY